MDPKTTLLRSSDFKRTPWKNGLGWTDQIAIFPENADLRRGDFDWRISTARVAQSAPFSPFAEHDRVLVILEGAGVKLSHTYEEGEPAEVVELPPAQPYEFPGDVPTRCELRDGPIQDFSVFIRKGTVFANVEMIQPDAEEPIEWEPQGRTCFIYVSQGSVDIGGTVVQAGEVLRMEYAPDQAPENMRMTPHAALAVMVQLN